MNIRILLFAAFALSTVALAQNDGPFQVRYAANLGPCRVVQEDAGAQNQLAPVDPCPDSAVNFTNTGANNAQDICVNTYTFSPDEQLVSCCSCRVTRNALWSLGVRRDLTSNTLTPGVENAVVIKLLATAAPAAGPCNPANPGPLVRGLSAWGTTLHASNLTTGFAYWGETPFTNSTLSAAELSVMTSFCGFIQANGSGYGICRSCQTGQFGLGPNDPSHNTGLGADKQ